MVTLKLSTITSLIFFELRKEVLHFKVYTIRVNTRPPGRNERSRIFFKKKKRRRDENKKVGRTCRDVVEGRLLHVKGSLCSTWEAFPVPYCFSGLLSPPPSGQNKNHETKQLFLLFLLPPSSSSF